MRPTFIGLLLCSCAGELVAGAPPLDDPELIAAVASLRACADLSYFEEEDHATAARVKALLQHVIHSGGASLVDDALLKLDDPDSDRRLRASLVLQSVPLDAERRGALLRSHDPHRWAWAMLSQDGFPDCVRPISLARQGNETIARAALDAVAAEVRLALMWSEEELAGLEPEYVRAYRQTLLPALERPGENAREVSCISADLTGDGRDEWVANVAIDDGWSGRRFTAVMQRGDETWHLLRLLEFDFSESFQKHEVMDVDGDGRGELVEYRRTNAGWSWQQLVLVDLDVAGASDEWKDRAELLLADPHDGGVWFARGDAFNNTGGGKSTYLVPSMGTRFVLSRLASSGETREVVVHTGARVW